MYITVNSVSDEDERGYSTSTGCCFHRWFALEGTVLSNLKKILVTEARDKK